MVPKVSIIMPVYNAEKTLSRMIDTVISQTLTEWELIAIDDGSVDGSGKILDGYASEDSRINVFHKQNRGVSAARQDGIDVAKGVYVIHADADDWLECDMLEELYNKAVISSADIVICDFYTNFNKEEKLVRQHIDNTQPAEVLLQLLNNQLYGSCWNKLVKRSCYEEYGVKFTKDINHCEDFLFLVQLLLHNDIKITYIPKAFYHYWQNESSITHNFTHKTYENRLRFIEALKTTLTPFGYGKEIQSLSFGVFIEAVIYNVLSKSEFRSNWNMFQKEIRHMDSMKWKVGLYFIKMGFNNIGYRLIHY